MVIGFLMLFIGLSLVTMAINVVQQKIEYSYMYMLKVGLPPVLHLEVEEGGGVVEDLLDEYMRQMEEDGVDVSKAGVNMVDAFQKSTKAKFLMPLLRCPPPRPLFPHEGMKVRMWAFSKDKARVAMNQFQEEAAAQGIELPDVLIDIDPDTGVPSALSPENAHKVFLSAPPPFPRRTADACRRSRSRSPSSPRSTRRKVEARLAGLDGIPIALLVSRGNANGGRGRAVGEQRVCRLPGESGGVGRRWAGGRGGGGGGVQHPRRSRHRLRRPGDFVVLQSGHLIDKTCRTGEPAAADSQSGRGHPDVQASGKAFQLRSGSPVR